MRNKYKILLREPLGDLHMFEIIILKWFLNVICKCGLDSAFAEVGGFLRSVSCKHISLCVTKDKTFLTSYANINVYRRVFIHVIG
jgi:hypothetical protein